MMILKAIAKEFLLYLDLEVSSADEQQPLCESHVFHFLLLATVNAPL